MLGATISFDQFGNATVQDPNLLSNSSSTPTIVANIDSTTTNPDYSNYPAWDYGMVSQSDLDSFANQVRQGFSLPSSTTDKSSQLKAKDVMGLVAILAVVLLVGSR